MMFVRNTAMHSLGPVFETDTPEGLFPIHRSDCAAAIWRRNPLPSFQSWINGLTPEQLPKARLILSPENVREAMFHICKKYGTPNCSERDRLIDDTAALAKVFSSIFHASCLQVRIDIVNTNVCQEFHIDAVLPRLVCTYRGTDTQYGFSTEGRDHKDIFTVPIGAPILLRDKFLQELPKLGLFSSSSLPEGTKETHFVLVIAPISPRDKKLHQENLH